MLQGYFEKSGVRARSGKATKNNAINMTMHSTNTSKFINDSNDNNEHANNVNIGSFATPSNRYRDDPLSPDVSSPSPPSSTTTSTTTELKFPKCHSNSRMPLRQVFKNVLSGFSSLRGSPSELYKAYALKFLDSYSYFSFSIIFTLFLSQDFGFDDVQAGSIYGLWGALITVYGLLAGMIIDNWGVAKSLKVGFALSLLARILIFWTTNSTILLFQLCVTLPMGNCLGIPVLTTGIRRYTTPASRGFAFGLFYVVMNVAALLSGPIVDMLTIWYKGEKLQDGNDDDINNLQQQDATNINDFDNHWTFSSYRAIILTGIIANLIACLITLTVREIKMDHDTTAIANNNNNNNDTTTTTNNSSNVSVFTPNGGSFHQILRETCQAPSFHRFLVVCLIVLNVRMIFRHLDATLPKYMIREFGDNVPKGTIYSINPALIIILVPLVTAATSETVQPLTMIHYGSYISAASVFCLAISTSVPACIAFVTILSIGEAIWSPRLYDYTMSVCKEGREGTYMALSSAPLFLAKLPVGFLSGYLLQKYCPEQGERHSKEMWLIIGLLTLSSPILLTLLWNYVNHNDDTDDDDDLDDPNAKYTELQTQLKRKQQHDTFFESDDHNDDDMNDNNNNTSHYKDADIHGTRPIV